MPIISQPVQELTNHILDPIIRQIVHRLLDRLGYRELIKERIYINTDWSTHSKTSDANSDAYISQESFKVDANIQMNPTSQKLDIYSFLHTDAYGISKRTLNNTEPVYLDMENKVRLIERRAPITIVLNCELILRSVEMAFRTPQMIFNGYESGSIHTYVDLAYDYPLPKPIISTLHALWEIDRIKGKPANISFINYLENNRTPWQLQKNRDINQTEFVIPSYNLQPLAILEYSDDSPKGIMEDRLASAYSIPFTYTIQFAIPSVLHLEFPVMINNQMVPGEYIPKDTQSRHNKLPEYWSSYGLEGFRTTYPEYHRYMKLPFYDDWVVPGDAPMRSSQQSPILVASIIVDEDQEYTTIDLKEEIDETFDISEGVRAILKIQSTESVDYDTIYNISVFSEDKQLIPHKDITISEDLVVKFKHYDNFTHYHLVLSNAINIHKINDKWFKYLKEYFKYLNPALQSQIRVLINSTWADPSIRPGSPYWPGDITVGGPFYIGPDGMIYDRHNRPIKHLSDSKFDINRGDTHATCNQNRINNFSINAYRSYKTQTRNKR